MKFSGWFHRAAAYLVDNLVVAPFFLAAGLLEDRIGAAAYAGLVALGLVVWGYNRWWRDGRTGQSWGRRLLRIRMVGEADGRPIGVGRALLRDLAHILDSAILYIGYLFPLWTAKRQTIADKVMRTVVAR